MDSLPSPVHGFTNPSLCPLDPPIHLSSVLMASSGSSSAYLSATQSSLSDSTSSGAIDPFSSSPSVRICDVFLGFCGHSVPLLRFVRWLRAELEAQGVRCFVSDRRSSDAFDHCAARAAIDAAAVGVVVITAKSFSNPYSMEEIRWFLERKQLVPLFFGLAQGDCTSRDIVERRGSMWEKSGGRLWTAYDGMEGEWMEAVNGVTCCPVKLEVNTSNFRDRILDVVCLLGKKLGRRSMVENVKRWRELAVEELPFPRNTDFVGRRSELDQLKQIFFSHTEENLENYAKIKHCGRHERNVDIDNNCRTVRGRLAKCGDTSSSGKEPVAWKESEDGIEMQGNWNGEWPVSLRRVKTPPNLPFRKGVACVCGDSGIGKTELLLEFAYMFSQNYKMVLWVGGESKYLRQNYLNLLPLLGVDVNVEYEMGSNSTRDGPRNFEEMEVDAIGKVRRELMRGIPYLLVIDNIESEKDWWDGRNIMELLPHFGGETHIIISSCLPQILNIRPLRLSYLSAAEAMILMNGRKTDLTIEDASSLRIIEEKLDRIPLGLAIVRAILSELAISPRKVLESINQVPYRELKFNREEYHALTHNPGLVQLLDLCFSIIDNAQKPSKLATKMVEASNWFAPSPIPISMLVIAASASSTKHRGIKFGNRCVQIFPCIFKKSDISISGVEVSSNLVRFSVARNSTRKGHISFHQIIKLYAYERDNGGNPSLVVKAIENEANLQTHANHIWAACFLLFKFGMDPGVIYLPTRDLLYFIRCFVLPLALLTFSKFSHCNAALELLHASTEALESLEDSFLSEVTNAQNKTMCFNNLRTQSTIQDDRLLYHDLANLRAILLETRAKFMLQGGQYLIGEHLCRIAVSIWEVIYGHEHPQTQATRRTMERLVWLQGLTSTFQACSSRSLRGLPYFKDEAVVT